MFDQRVKTETQDWYETPLYYDIIYDADSRVEAKFLTAVYEKFALRPSPRLRRALEPACGSGRLVRELSRRGWNVWGFDANPKMLAFAQKRASKPAQLWRDQMESFSVPNTKKFDLVHCLINTFRYLLTEKEAFAFLKLVQNAMRPGGVFVLGLHMTDYSRKKCEHERWVMDRKGVHVVCNTRTWPPQRRIREELLRTRLRITHRKKSWDQETVWRYRTYSAQELKKLLQKAAPRLRIVGCFDFNYDLEVDQDFDSATDDVILILQRDE